MRSWLRAILEGASTGTRVLTMCPTAATGNARADCNYFRRRINTHSNIQPFLTYHPYFIIALTGMFHHAVKSCSMPFALEWTAYIPHLHGAHSQTLMPTAELHFSNWLLSASGERHRRNVLTESLCTTMHRRTDGCRLDAGHNARCLLKDAVSSPSDELRVWRLQDGRTGRLSARRMARQQTPVPCVKEQMAKTGMPPDRYCHDGRQTTPKIGHRGDSRSAAGMPHSKMDPEACRC